MSTKKQEEKTFEVTPFDKVEGKEFLKPFKAVRPFQINRLQGHLVAVGEAETQADMLLKLAELIEAVANDFTVDKAAFDEFSYDDEKVMNLISSYVQYLGESKASATS